jgi:hypothetical protein
MTQVALSNFFGTWSFDKNLAETYFMNSQLSTVWESRFINTRIRAQKLWRAICARESQ